MTTEQKEAIEYLEESVLIYKNTLLKISEAIETVLNLIQEQEKEIEKKDKQIDLMAKQLAGLTIFDIDKEEPLILGDKEEIKQYFERKVEDENR